MSTNVLLCGNDADLLSIRGKVYTSDGYLIRLMNGVSQFLSLGVTLNPELVVLCHTLSRSECMQAIEHARACRPNSKILALVNDDDCWNDEVTHFNVSEGPAALLELSSSLAHADGLPAIPTCMR